MTMAVTVTWSTALARVACRVGRLLFVQLRAVCHAVGETRHSGRQEFSQLVRVEIEAFYR